MALVNGLWIGESLPSLARACVQSFLKRGHAFRLYSYRDIANVPSGCELCDAAAILPENRIIRYSRGPGRGSVALFSNMFRYKLLYELGGWWMDLDMFCLTESLPEEGIVLAQEDRRGLNCAIMRFPAAHEVMRLAYEECSRRGDDVEWAEMGPRLLTSLIEQFGLDSAIFPEPVFYPIHFSRFWVLFDPRRTAAAADAIRHSACVHLWNNMIGRANLDLAILPPAGSLLRNMYEWTIGIDGFTQEYALAPDCPPDALKLQIVQR